MGCELCQREVISRKNLPFEALSELYSDSHDGAYLWRCSACGQLFLKYWVEIFEDIWGYWVPVSEEEAGYFREGFQAGTNADAVLREVHELIRSRRRLVQVPGAGSLHWDAGQPLLYGPPW